MKWYQGNTGNHQCLIIDEYTGENIAVSYKKENAALIAAAPELLEALRAAWLYLDDDYEGTIQDLEFVIKSAINKADGI